MCLLSEDYIEEIKKTNPDLVKSMPVYHTRVDRKTARRNRASIKSQIEKIEQAKIEQARKNILDNIHNTLGKQRPSRNRYRRYIRSISKQIDALLKKI